jgi:GH18 family chitinase
MPKEKINFGMAFYGRTFKLVDPSKNYLGAPATGTGISGPVSLHYFTLMKNVLSHKKSFF